MTRARVRSTSDLARRRARRHGCRDQLIVAPLWPVHGLDLSTLLRTCDTVGACMVRRGCLGARGPRPRQHAALAGLRALDVYDGAA